ncbi:MAG: class I SAM-dependent methyltransferase [Deltaproteobacteria bacterium]|nr:MAG: class I SAM-dependent methyltransferase [Deltaproteobacteria bacterium]
MDCPLCLQPNASLHFQDRRRRYFLCDGCSLMFVAPEDHPSLEDEKDEYDLHENNPSDPKYRQFLHQLFEPLHQRLASESQGLDFGSGPGPTLSLMLEEVGHSVVLFDPFYANHPEVLERTYDFVCATEVVEHLHQPREALFRVWDCVKPGGVLAVMTQLWSEQPALERWRYLNDKTHVCFFSTATFGWLSQQWGARLERINRNVHFFWKDSFAQ